VVIPRYDGYLEPLHAIYHKKCLEPMRALIEANCLRISEVFCQGRIRYVTAEEIAAFDPVHLSFFNINTPEDLLRAQELAQLLQAGESIWFGNSVAAEMVEKDHNP